jgi:hypothetical protein
VIWRVVLITVSVFILTAVSQIGGAVLLAAMIFFPAVNKKVKGRWKQAFCKVTLFVVLYFISIVLLVPPVAALKINKYENAISRMPGCSA